MAAGRGLITSCRRNKILTAHILQCKLGILMTTHLICNNTISITALLNTANQFDHAITIAHSDLEKIGSVKYFEYCLELSWKTMKRVLNYRGVEADSPREAIRAAAKNNLISDPELWFEFLQLRNLTSHTYQKEHLNTAFKQLPTFNNELIQLIAVLEQL